MWSSLENKIRNIFIDKVVGQDGSFEWWSLNMDLNLIDLINEFVQFLICPFQTSKMYNKLEVKDGQQTFCQDGRFVRTALDILSGPTCLRRFVRTGLDVLSGLKYLDTVWTILSRYLGNIWAPLRRYMGNSLAQSGQYLGTTLTILEFYLGSAWALQFSRGSRSRPTGSNLWGNVWAGRSFWMVVSRPTRFLGLVR